MVGVSVNRFLHTCTLIVCNLTCTIIRLIHSYIKRLVNDRREEHGSVKIVHRSENFLIVDKPYDMYINSNNPDRKVRAILCLKWAINVFVNQALTFSEYPSDETARNAAGPGQSTAGPRVPLRSPAGLSHERRYVHSVE